MIIILFLILVTLILGVYTIYWYLSDINIELQYKNRLKEYSNELLQEQNSYLKKLLNKL